jgi:hypothetical protein
MKKFQVKDEFEQRILELKDHFFFFQYSLVGLLNFTSIKADANVGFCLSMDGVDDLDAAPASDEEEISTNCF